MIARRPASFLLLAALTAALQAAPVTPGAGVDPRDAIPSLPTAAAKTSPALPPASIPPAGTAPASIAPAPASTGAKPNDAATKSPEVPSPAAPRTTTAETHQAGILSAVKAKGPPAVSKPAAAPPLSPRFQQIRARMAALFDTRNAASTAVDPLANPFRPAGAVPLAPLPSVDGAAPEPNAPSADLTALQQAVATLRVKGTVQRGKTLQLVITSAPGKEGTYKEGDIINVPLPPGDPVHVRVRQVSAHSVTLTVNDAEMVLKF